MSEQEIEQLAILLGKAKATLTPIGKGGPDYISVNNGVLVGTSIQVYNGVISDYKWDTTSEDNDVIVSHFNCY
jgi:hypothetical protein